jgi:hypothetical protein
MPEYVEAIEKLMSDNPKSREIRSRAVVDRPVSQAESL